MQALVSKGELAKEEGSRWREKLLSPMFAAPESVVSDDQELVRILKKLRPDLIIVLGGPEVSHETDLQEICRLADHVIFLWLGELVEQGPAARVFAQPARAAFLSQFVLQLPHPIVGAPGGGPAEHERFHARWRQPRQPGDGAATH